FTLRSPGQAVAKHFELAETPLFEPRYNIAPTQPAPVVRLTSASGRRVFDWLRWGLVPSWAKDLDIGNQLINARGETLASKPAFRHAFRQRRCLVVADGFYEWQRQGKRKQPFYITAADGSPLAFAGLWERWQSPGAGQADKPAGEASPIESCTIITTSASECVRALHDRMPVILPRETWTAWLDPAMDDSAALHDLMNRCAVDGLVSHPVDALVNSPANDSSRCIEPLTGGDKSKPVDRMLF
ncbi:MAG: SOS response-associated peptidase, partial [Candidatus Saccharimonadales bacterium]